MKRNAVIIAPLIILSFTFFFKQCEGCQKKKPGERDVKISVSGGPAPMEATGAASHLTFSSGFPVPIFDVAFVKVTKDNYQIKTQASYPWALSVIINLTVAAGTALLFIRLAAAGRWAMVRKILIIISVNMVLFNLSVLLVYYPQFITTFLVYVYLYPVAWIKYFIELLPLKLPDFNIPSRIYFVLLSFVLYFITLGISTLRDRFKKKTAIAGDR